jgi:hypothetical protein
MTKPFTQAVDRLGELLGQEHDLTVLTEFVEKAEGGARRATPSALRLLKMIERQRLELRRRAHAAGDRLFAEKPRAYVGRLDRWWQAAVKTSGEPLGRKNREVADRAFVGMDMRNAVSV